MADNTTLNLGSGGDVIATEDIGGVKIQRVKIVAGDKDSDGTDASNHTPLPVTGTVTANQGGTWNIGTVTTLPTNTAFNLGQISGTAPPSANIAGTIAVGGAVSNAANVNAATNPLIIAGSDYGAIPKVQMPKVDSSGGMYINILGSPTVVQSNASNFLATVSGTVAATQSGTWNVGLINNPVTVSGTVTAVSANASNFLSTISGTVTAIQSNASNFLTTVSGTVAVSTLPANTAFNLAQISGTAPPNANIAGTLSVGGASSNSTNINATTNPLLIAGSDYTATPKVQTAKIDSTGGQYVTILGSPTVVQSNASNFLTTVSGTVGITANSAFNLSQVSGTTTDTNSGTKTAGTLRVVLATDQPQLTNKLLVTPDANIAYNLSQVLGQTVASTVTGIQDVNPRKFDGTTGLTPKYFVSRISSKLTTYVTNSTAYLSTLKVVTSNVGTGATMNINDQSGSGNRTLSAPNFPGGNMTLGTFLETSTDPVKFTGGIQIITGGTTFGDCNVAVTFWA